MKQEIRKNRDYIIVGLQPYDSPIGSNCINIANEIAKHNRVLYVNNPLDTKTLLNNRNSNDERFLLRKKVLSGATKALTQKSTNLWELNPRVTLNSINWLPDNWMYDLLNKRNNNHFAREIKKAIKNLDFKDFILFNDSDMLRSFYLKELLKPVASVYYSRDNLITQDYFNKHGERLEAKLIKKSNAATANSLYLRDYCQQFNPNSYYVGQGCETDLFDPNEDHEKPEDLPNNGKPIIGYIGALLQIRLDIPLLEKLAESKPDWNFVMVGPEDEHFKASKLHQQNNVFFTGSKKPTELPQYLSYFDVALNPQALNELTVGNYPRKIDEYLAMGKPSVATKTRAMEIFKDHVYLAEGLEEYQNYIEQALNDNSPEKEKARIDFARGHTWEASTREIYAAIEKSLL